MSQRYKATLAPTPDFHCDCCGTGLFYHKPWFSSQLKDAGYDVCFELCPMCHEVEQALIQQSQTAEHPLRLEHYRAIHARHNPTTPRFSIWEKL